MQGRFVVFIALFAFTFALPQVEEQPEGSSTSAPETVSAKRRQFIAPPPVFAQPPVVAPAPVVVAPVGQCPGGPSLPIECDPKRPWPSCPPQSYCYATNSVDIGPYFCCPIWSTYGAAWRPATPFYNYVPPPPSNWPEALRVANWPAAAVSMPMMAAPVRPLKKKTEQKFNDDITNEEQQKIDQSMANWLDRQAKMH